ncbi:hypothetical protein N7450_009842 [Penicillium hetheringtonii]|uniref:4-hydroxy-3-methoxy-5-polyprenylbenzoate decarboxylase n=1 Tax=Penicillium hetheringtonii TaxID=911720 RepID=A0AAD6GNT6_9EURO|nr:hypothetical protein N7450_009842 [Penicillium hetheringtonii]
MSLVGRRGAKCLRSVSITGQLSPCTSNLRPFSVLNRPQPNYPGHIPLTTIERGALAIGSALGSLVNPRRAANNAPKRPHRSSRRSNRNPILYLPTPQRNALGPNRPTNPPRSSTHHFRNTQNGLSPHSPENSVGRTYAKWLDREGVSPDTRDNVQYIDDEECAYVMQRYRECHDFYHAVTGLPIFVEERLSLFAFVRMKPAEKERFLKLHLPWAVRSGLASKELINVYWEKVLEKDVDELRRELNIEQPPDLREIRKMIRRQQKQEKERLQQQQMQQ